MIEIREQQAVVLTTWLLRLIGFFLPLVKVIGRLNLFLGAVLIVIDWLLLEGPPIVPVGAVLLAIASAVRGPAKDT